MPAFGENNRGDDTADGDCELDYSVNFSTRLPDTDNPDDDDRSRFDGDRSELYPTSEMDESGMYPMSEVGMEMSTFEEGWGDGGNDDIKIGVVEDDDEEGTEFSSSDEGMGGVGANRNGKMTTKNNYSGRQTERPEAPLRHVSKISSKPSSQQNHTWKVLSIFMLVIGIVAIGFGVVFALGLVDFGGGGSRVRGNGVGSESESNGNSSGGFDGAEAGLDLGGRGGETSDSTAEPTERSTKPTTVPTSLKPTEAPTTAPTYKPTDKPTVPAPTYRPTTPSPSQRPTPNIWTSTPTTELAAGGGPPPPPGYFNYDPNDALYGFANWLSPTYAMAANISRNQDDDLVVEPAEQSSAEFKFWSEYAWSINTNKKTNITDNFCDPATLWGRGRTGRAEQSPIDVRVTEEVDEQTGEAVEARCFEHHEIRTKPGQFQLESTKIEKQILPSKLRLNYPEPKFDSDGNLASDSKLPLADFPHGWGGNMEVLRVDVKIPSEHWLEGKEYAAEVQIYHLHHKKKKAPVISVLVDLHPRDEKNRHFQRALNEWQKVWEVNYLECENRRRRERRLDAGLFEAVRGWVDMGNKRSVGGGNMNDRGTWLDEPLDEEQTFQRHLRSARRKAQQEAYWDPYDEEIMRSIHFYGYDGSLTEPPCSEFISWRIIDTPMLVSTEQLFQMKNLLFRHRDLHNNCRLASNHFMGSVARRPLQPINSRKVYRCTCRDFLSDAERDAILAEDGLTEDNATYTPKCSKEEFRKSEEEKPWLGAK